jgi:hypothetical protein
MAPLTKALTQYAAICAIKVLQTVCQYAAQNIKAAVAARHRHTTAAGSRVKHLLQGLGVGTIAGICPERGHAADSSKTGVV